MGVERAFETNTGHYIISQADGRRLGTLFYEHEISLDRGVNSRARLQLPSAENLEEYKRRLQTHFFENGHYTYTEFSGTQYFDTIELKSGINLCRMPDLNLMKDAVKRAGNHTHEARLIEKEYEAASKRFKPLIGIIKEFSLPSDVKEVLREANVDVVKLVIGYYLK